MLALPANLLPLAITNPFFKFLFSLVFGILVAPILGGASIVLADRALDSQTIDLSTALSMAWQRAGQLILASLLLGIILVPSFMLLLIPGIYLAIRLFAVQYETMLERRAASDALQASWDLTAGRWWEVFSRNFTLILVLIGPIIFLSLVLREGGPLVDLLVSIIGIAITPIVMLAFLLVYRGIKGQELATTQ
ncbi:MAG: hypothetical protein AAGA83_01490 [Cyanobacteria bacterium P01_F01_bin.116]